MADVTLPLATIAIPTFNRAELLKRAVASARVQDYPYLEILIVDNASEDNTQDVCQDLVAHDSRIRYIRQARNVGPVQNSATGLKSVRGYYFMWLADDDWISPNYARRCTDEVEAGGHVIVAGTDYWCVRETAIVVDPVRALERETAVRLFHYLKVVSSNAAATYGIARTQGLRNQLPFPRGVGGDWLWPLGLLSTGTLEVVADANLYREQEGISSDFRKMAAQLGEGKLASRFPQLVISWNVYATLARGKGPVRIAYPRILAMRAGTIAAIRLEAIGNLVLPVRVGLQQMIPRELYAILKRCYRPLRGSQDRVRSRFLDLVAHRSNFAA